MTDSTPMENRIRNPVRVTTASAPGGGGGVGAAADASQANRSVSEQSSST